MIKTYSLSILTITLSLLSQLHQTTADYSVYICSIDLESYFQNTPHVDTIKGMSLNTCVCHIYSVGVCVQAAIYIAS